MYGQHDNKEDFEGPAFRALGAFPQFAESFQNDDDGFKNFPGENSLEPIAWRSTSDGFGGGMFDMGGSSGWAPQEMSLNPKFAAPSFGGHKDLYQPQGWAGHQATQSKTMGLSSLSSSLEPPHAPGGYIEPHWHFVSSTPCALLFQTLQAWLEHNSVDYVVKPTKFMCKCVVYRNGSKLPFSIRIFATQTRKQYAVEFNRRSGDTIVFSELYRKAKAELAEDGHVNGYQATTPSILPDLPPLELEGQEASASAVSDTVNCLVAMATCGAVDMEEQALAALSDITADSARCPFGAFPPQATDMLVQALQSHSADTNRCALTCLANLVLSGTMELCQRLAEQQVISTLLTLTNAESAQVARESARTLANMAEIMKAPMVDYEPRLRTELPALERSPDVRVRGYAAALQRICV